MCIAQRKSDLSEERVVLFVKMANDSVFSPEFVKVLKNRIRMELSARHVPSVILKTKGIPVSIDSDE